MDRMGIEQVGPYHHAHIGEGQIEHLTFFDLDGGSGKIRLEGKPGELSQEDIRKAYFGL